MQRMATLAAQAGVPVLGPLREFAAEGSLISYGASIAEVTRRRLMRAINVSARNPIMAGAFHGAWEEQWSGSYIPMSFGLPAWERAMTTKFDAEQAE
jgi:hypothetical protein